MSDVVKLKNDMRRMMQDTGDAIADVLNQMLKGDWHDDHGHAVKMNAQMLHLRDVLAAMTDYRNKNPWTLERGQEPSGGE